jgi:ribosomal protein L7Ae-like RNA K-turn-binding protein
LVDRIEDLLVRRCGDSLGLARRAGGAVAGFDRVGEALRHGRAALLLCALDGAEGGRQKLAGLARELPSASVLSAAELGAAFGRERVVHVAVGGGALCDRLLLDLARLAGLRPGAVVSAAVGTTADDKIGLVPARLAIADGGTEAHD